MEARVDGTSWPWRAAPPPAFCDNPVLPRHWPATPHFRVGIEVAVWPGEPRRLGARATEAEWGRRFMRASIVPCARLRRGPVQDVDMERRPDGGSGHVEGQNELSQAQRSVSIAALTLGLSVAGST